MYKLVLPYRASATGGIGVAMATPFFGQMKWWNLRAYIRTVCIICQLVCLVILSQSELYTGPILHIDKMSRVILGMSLNEKFASSNQQERVHNTTPFIWLLRYVGFEFMQVFELMQVQYGPAT